MYTILIAEDDKDIASLLKLYLESSSYKVLVAHDGEAAYELFKTKKVDLAVLDVMMPKMNGYDLTKKIRSESTIPILILSAKNSDVDKIEGLAIGADDYITKPFNFLEVVARVQSNLRRYFQFDQVNQSSPNTLRLGELELDIEGASLTKNGQPIKLTATELKIIQILMSAPGQIFTKLQIYESVNGQYIEGDDSTIIVHISNLREKIEDNSKNPKYIKTLRGIGYKIEKDIE